MYLSTPDYGHPVTVPKNAPQLWGTPINVNANTFWHVPHIHFQMWKNPIIGNFSRPLIGLPLPDTTALPVPNYQPIDFEWFNSISANISPNGKGS